MICNLTICHMQAWDTYPQDVSSNIYKLIQLQHEQAATSELPDIKVAVLRGIVFQELDSLQRDRAGVARGQWYLTFSITTQRSMEEGLDQNGTNPFCHYQQPHSISFMCDPSCLPWRDP